MYLYLVVIIKQVFGAHFLENGAVDATAAHLSRHFLKAAHVPCAVLMSTALTRPVIELRYTQHKETLKMWEEP